MPHEQEEAQDPQCGTCESPDGECECVSCVCCDEQGPDLVLYDDQCGHCQHCCECTVCSGCDNRGDFSLCENCEYCSEYGCCECSWCDACCAPYNSDATCGRCGYCESCCDCSNDGIPYREHESPRFWKAKRNQHRINPSNRFVALEIEVNSSSSPDAIEYAVDRWGCNVVGDGSLTGNGAFEIPTAPASGDLFCEQMDDLGKALREAGARVNDNCGLHVHIDARDYTYYDMRRLLKLYGAIEPALLEMMPESRRRHHYCRPCGKKYTDGLDKCRAPKDSKADLIEKVYGTVENGRYERTRKYASSRYNALNMHSWFYRGTVEYRLHTGTVNPSKMKAWGMLWASIIDKALAMSETDVNKAVKSARLDKGRRLLLKLAGTDTARQYVKRRWRKFTGRDDVLTKRERDARQNREWLAATLQQTSEMGSDNETAAA